MYQNHAAVKSLYYFIVIHVSFVVLGVILFAKKLYWISQVLNLSMWHRSFQMNNLLWCFTVCDVLWPLFLCKLQFAVAVINEWFNWIFDFIVSIIHVGYKGNAVGIWGWEYDKTHWTGKERAGWFKVCLLTHSFLYNWQKYSTGRKFSLDLNFTNSLMANLLNLNPLFIVHQPWAKCGLFAAAALWSIFCGLIAAFWSKKFVKRLMAHTITSSTADESPEFLCAAGKIVHRA